MRTVANSGERSLEGYRDYLRMLVRLQAVSVPESRIDTSDIVQQAMLHAHQHRSQFRGTSEAEWLGWLRTILSNTLAAAARRLDTKARQVSREQSLDQALESSPAGMDPFLAANLPTPSESFSRVEEAVRLAAALECLPEDQRRVVELHHLRGLGLAEVAFELKRSKSAIVGLLFRGLKRLREILERNGGELK